MKKILGILILFCSVNALATPFDDLSTEVRSELGILFSCTENVKKSRCHKILKGLMKYKNNIITLRDNISLFHVKIGQFTTTTGINGITVPYNKSSEEILVFLEAQSAVEKMNCTYEPEQRSWWNSCVSGYTLSCSQGCRYGASRAPIGKKVSFDDFINPEAQRDDETYTPISN